VVNSESYEINESHEVMRSTGPVIFLWAMSVPGPEVRRKARALTTEVHTILGGLAVSCCYQMALVAAAR
jgi:hypothetical protein